MILNWILIGLLVGIVMGLTGAGGAVISVPLFIHLTGMDVRSATAMALVAVLAGAWFNWFFQRTYTDLRVALSMMVFSLVGSFMFTGVKAASPDWVIKALFIAVCSFSAVTMLRPRRTPAPQGIAAGADMAPADARFWLKASSSGTVLGALTTMTGLGGGVLLMPWLLGPMGLPPARALATSLFTIGLVAVGSLANQALAEPEKFGALLSLGPVWMACGILFAAGMLHALTHRLEVDTVARLRKVVFLVIVAVAIAGLILKSS